MTRQSTSQTIYKHHGTDGEAGDAVFQHHRRCLASSQAPKTKKKLKNQPLRRPRPAQEEGLRLLSGAKVMHNGQWVGLNEWGRAAAALRVRPEAIEIRGGLCVLSTKKMVDTMKKQGSLLVHGDCDLCGLPIEEWFNKGELSEGEFGTYNWAAPAGDPLSALAVQLSRYELAWTGSDFLPGLLGFSRVPSPPCRR